MEFPKQEKEQLSTRVANLIQEKIVNNSFPIDSRLPAERELADMFGVSRNIVREATKLLQERGLVRVLSGSGVYVCAREPNVLSRSVMLYVQRQSVTIAQLYETRWIIEIQNARLAAERATPADIEALTNCLTQSDAAPGGSVMMSELDVAFHRLLAVATQNPTLPLLLDPLTDALQQQVEMTSHLPGAKENALNHHRKIFDAVKARDGQAAYAAMSDHLQNSWEWLLRALDNPQDEIGALSFPENL